MRPWLSSIVVAILNLLVMNTSGIAIGGNTDVSYDTLYQAFRAPDHAYWGEVPLWWWEGDPLTEARVTWQLDTLAAKGVKAVCPIQRSPARCEPSSFTPEWWKMFAFVHQQCRQRGMRLWAYDQIGYGHYGWLEKAAAKARDPATARIEFKTADAGPHETVRIELPNGQLLGARAYPLHDGRLDDGASRNVASHVSNGVLKWTAPDGAWRVTISVAVPEVRFRLSPKATDIYLDLLYGELERRCGTDAMGRSFAGVFQDEHPPTPRDAYTDTLGKEFRARFGYDLARALTALHYDVGPKTPRYRSDFFDAYLAEDERCYWRRVFDWICKRGLLTSHDNWGRNSLPSQSQGYIDYFRTQRWFSAPGNDDYAQAPATERNYYDTKIAASIARLYHRPRVWLEAFHSSGWGRTTDQTLSWLSADYAFGANLYDEHGLYYSTRAATWEHAAPDPHWRQPYWRYYGTLSDWVARTSYIMSQGIAVVDVAVHYPVVSFLAGPKPGAPPIDYNYYMTVSRTIYDAAIDNDIIDDDSILRGTVKAGKLHVENNRYQALVFGPEETVRTGLLQQALKLARSGGCVVFHGRLPTASVEVGRDDPNIAALLKRLLGKLPHGGAAAPTGPAIGRAFPLGGYAAWVPELKDVPSVLSRHVTRDFLPQTGAPVFVAHRRIGTVDVYLVQNTAAQPLELDMRCRVDGVPERWDPFTGTRRPVDAFTRDSHVTRVHQRLEGNVAQLIVFRPGRLRSGHSTRRLLQPDALTKSLPTDWEFAVIPTRDNRWGEFRWPPAHERIGPESRQFRYRLEPPGTAEQPAWWRTDFDDRSWSNVKYSMGPYWLWLGDLPKSFSATTLAGSDCSAYAPGLEIPVSGKRLAWRTVEFSQEIGLGRPAPWGGHSGYPDGAIDQNFIDLPPGRKVLFTRIRSVRTQRLGLRIALRNSSARLWVNGVEQPIEDAVGSLPLQQGINNILIELPDGGRGMLYVQTTPPAATTLAHVETSQAPPLARAQWIQASDSGAGYVRKTFTLEQLPKHAKLVVTAYTGYRLFVNGHQVEEDIGPWAKWTHPETVDVTRYLRQGKNVIGAWIQVHSGQNVHGKPADQALIMAMRVVFADGTATTLLTDGTWKCAVREFPGWKTAEFADASWHNVRVFGRMGIEPWGTAPLDNVGAVSTPRRQLAVAMPNPYLTCFDEAPDIVYDVKPPQQRWFGWYRFLAPPGLRAMHLHTSAPAQVWVDGKPAAVRDGVARPTAMPAGVSQVAIRLEMQPGAYGGAAFPLPISFELEGGVIQPGPWANFALPTYAGIGVYRQHFKLSATEAGRSITLDLGTVLVAAEVLVNGKRAGVRLARPFKFDLSGLVHKGDNLLEVRVANTLAPHYTVTNTSHNLGPTKSGLLGPVLLRQRLGPDEWTSWAHREVKRLESVLATTTAALAHAQQVWEQTAGWKPVALQLAPAMDGHGRMLPDGSVRIGSPPTGSKSVELQFDASLPRLTGLRLESWPLKSDHADIAARVLESLATGAHVTLAVLPPKSQLPRGSRLRIQIPGRTEYLHLAEVQVFCNGTNIALKGTAQQSSTSLGASAQRAIDGNTNGLWSNKSVTHTLHQREPWWEVDLGTDQPIDRIVIWNRTDGQLEDRLHDFRVLLYNRRGDIVWQQTVLQPPRPSATLHLSSFPITLRRVVPAAERFVQQHQGARFSERTADSSPRHAVAIFAAERPFRIEPGTAFRLRLGLPELSDFPSSRLRVSITQSKPPLCDLPAGIAHLLQQPAAQRSPRDRVTLADFYRSVAPQLAPQRKRLRVLKTQLQLVAKTDRRGQQATAE